VGRDKAEIPYTEGLMEIYKDNINANQYSLFTLSDVHEGNSGHNESSLDLAISLIKETAKTRHVEVTLNGDLIDCIELTDKRFNPIEISDKYKLRDLKDLPRKQADYIIEKLDPIKEHIKYATVGNHEESYQKEHHFDVYDYYCTALGCKKLGYAGLMRKVFHGASGKSGARQIDICISHGRGGGGGKREGYAINYVVDIMQKFDVDVGIVGHIHQLIAKPYPSVHINKNLNMEKRVKWYVVAGCFLDTYIEGSSGYFEGKAGQLSDIGMVEIRVDRISDTWNLDCREIRL
jgi:UDP-2,3-diacylglucosamine pyrophosphatase LpxH